MAFLGRPFIEGAGGRIKRYIVRGKTKDEQVPCVLVPQIILAKSGGSQPKATGDDKGQY
jgi:hypothetical protein